MSPTSESALRSALSAGQWAREDQVVAGDVLVADDGFTCIEADARLIVEQAPHGLAVPCGEGLHYLDGQLDDEGRYVGFVKADAQ